MSYAFQVAKKNGTLVFTASPETLVAIAAHVPDDAVFTISGHHPSPGYSTIGSLSVQLSVVPEDGGSHFVGSSVLSYNTQPAPVTSAPVQGRIHQVSGTASASSGAVHVDQAGL